MSLPTARRQRKTPQFPLSLLTLAFAIAGGRPSGLQTRRRRQAVIWLCCGAANRGCNDCRRRSCGEHCRLDAGAQHGNPLQRLRCRMLRRRGQHRGGRAGGVVQRQLELGYFAALRQQLELLPHGDGENAAGGSERLAADACVFDGIIRRPLRNGGLVQGSDLLCIAAEAAATNGELRSRHMGVPQECSGKASPTAITITPCWWMPPPGPHAPAVGILGQLDGLGDALGRGDGASSRLLRSLRPAFRVTKDDRHHGRCARPEHAP